MRIIMYESKAHSLSRSSKEAHDREKMERREEERRKVKITDHHRNVASLRLRAARKHTAAGVWAVEAAEAVHRRKSANSRTDWNWGTNRYWGCMATDAGTAHAVAAAAAALRGGIAAPEGTFAERRTSFSHPRPPLSRLHQISLVDGTSMIIMDCSSSSSSFTMKWTP